jgi:hypothetical protein
VKKLLLILFFIPLTGFGQDDCGDKPDKPFNKSARDYKEWLVKYNLWIECKDKSDETLQHNELIELPLNSNIKILYAGDYQKGELDVKMFNREWWGLFEQDNISYVRKVKLKLEKLKPDIQYDWEYRLSVDDNENCIILFSGFDPTEREINHYTNNNTIRNNEEFTFEFGPYHTFLNSELKKTESIGKVLRRDYSINLNYKSNKKLITQELFLFPCYGHELIISLIWAGDLDYDGKTDFIIQIPTPQNNEIGDSTGLFLSSEADSNDLVKLVAYFISSGC